MRTKDDILGQVEKMYAKTSRIDERHIISINLYLEVLIDIRDLGRAFYDRLIDFIEARD